MGSGGEQLSWGNLFGSKIVESDSVSVVAFLLGSGK